MINTGLFFNKKLSIGNIFFDGHTQEVINYTVTPTSSPVEFGANVVDNAIVQPITIEVDVFVGDIVAFNLSAKNFFNTFKKTADALQVLRQAMVDRNTLDVICNLGYFSGMMIVGVTSRNTTDAVDTVFAKITLKQIIFVGSDTGFNPSDPKYNGSVNTGVQQTSSAPQ